MVGNGYTDHCANCLWSMHVDVNPGDREADCRGPMEPISAEPTTKGYKIHYRCKKCGLSHCNKSAEDDNFEVILRLISQPTARRKS